MANYLNQQLQDFARAAGAVYQGDGMGLHHFKELSTNSNFSLRIPPAGSRECITSDKILVRAQEARRSYGKPEPEAVTEAAKSLRVQCGNGNTVDGWYDRLSRNWVVQVKDSEETQIGDAEYSGSRGSFENSMQCLIDQNGGRSEHIPNRTGHMAESESSQELSYEETLYRGDEQAEVKVVITATYYGAEAGMPQSYASGGSPPDAARVDFDSIRAFKVDGSHEKVELDDDERAAAEARLSTMAEGGFADDLGADDRD
jgi:hypothetical protein